MTPAPMAAPAGSVTVPLPAPTPPDALKSNVITVLAGELMLAATHTLPSESVVGQKLQTPLTNLYHTKGQEPVGHKGLGKVIVTTIVCPGLRAIIMNEIRPSGKITFTGGFGGGGGGPAVIRLDILPAEVVNVS